MIRTQDGFVAGSDSKAIDENDKVRSEPQCKIQQVGKILFAASGFIEYKGRPFNVSKIVSQAAHDAASIDDIVAKFEGLVFGPLVDAVSRFKKTNPVQAQEAFRKGTFALILFTIKDGVPLILAKQYGEPDLILRNIPAISTVRCPGSDCLEKEKPFLLGRSEAIESFLKQYPPPWGLDLMDIVRFFIMLEIIAAPKEVGGQIDLVRYDRSGIHWQRKPECEEQNKQTTPKRPRRKRHIHNRS